MNEVDTAWVAGLLEGEGSFIWRKTKSAKVSCAMTDEDVIERLQTLCGGRVCRTTQQQAHHKPAWIWWTSGQVALDLIQAVLPHLGIRRTTQAQLVLDSYERHRRSKDDHNEIRRAAADAYRRGEGSLRDIAKRFGVSHVTVRNWL